MLSDVDYYKKTIFCKLVRYVVCFLNICLTYSLSSILPYRPCLNYHPSPTFPGLSITGPMGTTAGPGFTKGLKQKIVLDFVITLRPLKGSHF